MPPPGPADFLRPHVGGVGPWAMAVQAVHPPQGPADGPRPHGGESHSGHVACNAQRCLTLPSFGVVFTRVEENINVPRNKFTYMHTYTHTYIVHTHQHTPHMHGYIHA